MTVEQAIQNLRLAAEKANASAQLSLVQAHAVVVSLEVLTEALWPKAPEPKGEG